MVLCTAAGGSSAQSFGTAIAQRLRQPDRFARTATSMIKRRTTLPTQYTLAMDRGAPRDARQAHPLHSTVPRLASYATQGTHQGGKCVSAWGGLASEAFAAPPALGLGVHERAAAVRLFGAS
jgi:PEP-utilising enzyme, PEP-binding domain